MSLRLRLTLAILAVVAVMGMVGLVSFRINRGIQRQVARLGPTSVVEIGADAVVGQPVELEGRWEEEGHFLAKEVERLPWSRRPKLRGPVQEIDAPSRILTLYGIRIRTTDETQLSDEEPGGVDLARLAVGQRVEVSCTVDEQGRWTARRIELRVTKASDKIKGTVTRAQPLAGGGSRLEIEGLPIHVPPGVGMTQSSGPLHRMEVASGMTLALQEILAAAQELLKERYKLRTARARADEEEEARLEPLVESAEDRLSDGHEAFTRCLAESRSIAEQRAARSGLGTTDSLEGWLEPLEADRERLEGSVAELLEEAREDLARAEVFLEDELEPFLQERVMPRVHAYLLQVEEDLQDELRAIAADSDAAARLVLYTNVAGFLLALGAGLLVSRGIVAPLRALETAADQVARGNLQTRVEVDSRDEIGVLAAAFNHMTAELARTTLSVDELNNVIDSMAGALFLLDAEERIVNVNPAAARLLGYQRGELVGIPFAELLQPEEPADAAAPVAAQAQPADVSVAERVLRRKDSSRVPVSFCRAPLRAEPGAEAGSVCMALDLSERKRMEERLRRSLAEKELLVREVHHRVKSNLQVISSLLDLQSRSITDRGALSRFQQSQDRIRSLVFIHEQLYRTENLTAIDLQAYLEVLVANLAQLHLDEDSRIEVRVEVDEMTLDLDRSLACGLIVNELVTNALRHAFDREAQVGRIVVSCRRTADGLVRLGVRDDGRGFQPRASRVGAEGSLGLELVETLVEQLHGQLSFDGSAGAGFQVEFPAATPERAA